VYEHFFNLKTKPFELLPNPDFLFMSKAHRRVLNYLEYAITEKYGFVLFTGEVGSGKTTLMRCVLRGMDNAHVVSRIFNTNVTSEELISLVNEDFGLDVKGKNKVRLFRELNDFLIEQYAEGKQSILIIDEAHNLTPELLEETRMLSNLETDNAKLLHIMLIGQPELRETLALPELRQLRQRINISCHLNPLPQDEIHAYILHRLEVAGNRDAIQFSNGVIGDIFRFSRGIPRLVNIICDFLLLAAHIEGTRQITGDMASDIIKELQLEMPMQDEVRRDSSSNTSSSERMEKHLKCIIDEMRKMNKETHHEAPGKGNEGSSAELNAVVERKIQQRSEETKKKISTLEERTSDVFQNLERRVRWLESEGVKRGAGKNGGNSRTAKVEEPETGHGDLIARMEERLKEIEAAVRGSEESGAELKWNQDLEERLRQMVEGLIRQMMPVDAPGGKAMDTRVGHDQDLEKQEIQDKITLLESNLATVVENSAKNFHMLRKRFNEILLELRPKKDVRLSSQRSMKVDARK
jgi:putative secretion ATPase (PEP-CTERM system associated)